VDLNGDLGVHYGIVKTKLALVIWAALTLPARLLFAAPDEMLQAQMHIYRYAPERLADPWAGTLWKRGKINLAGLWYVRMSAATARTYTPEALADLAWSRQVPGFDFTGEKGMDSFFLESFAKRYADLGRSSRQFPKPSIRLLKLRGTRVGDGIAHSVFSLRDLEVLQVDSETTDASVRLITVLGKLRDLSVRNTRITDASMEFVATLSNLEKLDLTGTAVTAKGLARLKGLSLKELRIGSKIDASAVPAILQWTSLESLDLSQTNWQASDYARLNALTNLHTLFLGKHVSAEALHALQKLPGLKRLDLTSSTLQDADLAALHRFKSLEELSVAGTRITDAGLQTIAGLESLRYLDVSATRTTLQGLKALTRLEALEALAVPLQGGGDRDNIAFLGKLENLRVLLINGRILAPVLLEGLKEETRRSSARFFPWISLAHAEEGKDPIDEFLMASAKESKPTFSGFSGSGLRRLHQAESELDRIASAPSDIRQDSFEEKEDNFLGEFTVESGIASPDRAKPRK